MHRPHRLRVAATALLLAAGLTACGAAPSTTGSGAPVAESPSASSASASPSVSLLDGCVQAGEGTRFAIPVTGRTISGAVLGSGPRTVILSNQSDSSLCGWLDEARRLAGLGYRVVLWDQDAVEWPDAIAAVVADQRAGGARSIVLMGASKGGWASAIAAGTITPAVQGLVSLSGEGSLRGRTVYAELRRFRGPVLVISTLHDGLSSDTLTTFPKAHGTASTTVLPLSGDLHGWQLFRSEHATAVRTAIDAFLAQTLR